MTVISAATLVVACLVGH